MKNLYAEFKKALIASVAGTLATFVSGLIVALISAIAIFFSTGGFAGLFGAQPKLEASNFIWATERAHRGDELSPATGSNEVYSTCDPGTIVVGGVCAIQQAESGKPVAPIRVMGIFDGNKWGCIWDVPGQWQSPEKGALSVEPWPNTPAMANAMIPPHASARARCLKP